MRILASATQRLESLLGDITGVLEAELFDDELEAADALLAANHRRAAGVGAGVVLERHLKRLIQNHAVTFRKKAMLGNLNEALKEAKVYGVPEWRRIQHLTDLRTFAATTQSGSPPKPRCATLSKACGAPSPRSSNRQLGGRPSRCPVVRFKGCRSAGL